MKEKLCHSYFVLTNYFVVKDSVFVTYQKELFTFLVILSIPVLVDYLIFNIEDDFTDEERLNFFDFIFIISHGLTIR